MKTNEEKLKRQKLVNVIGIIVIVILLLLLISVLRKNDRHHTVESPVDGSGNSLVIDEDAIDWNGSKRTDFTEVPEDEGTAIPGYTRIVVNENNQSIQLYNFEDNTSYLIYTIYDSNGKEVFKTNAIAPGKAVYWNVYETMGQGEHVVDMNVSTFDVDTQVECCGAVMADVPVIVQ